MKKLGMVICMAVGALLVSAPVFAQNDNHQGQGHAVITVLAKHGGDTPVGVSQQDLKLAVNGKQSNITNWVSLRGPEDPLELVLLIDSAARTSLGRQLDEMAQFIKSLPPNTKSTIGYMQNGQAVLSGPLSADHAQVLRGLHLPVGSAGSSASPYFCLSDLAKHWPSTDRLARREVVMVTDGITEARRGNNFLGVDGLETLAQRIGPATSLKELTQAIYAGAQEFSRGHLRDDACLLLARRK